jgi:glycosyltransferase involved in cell wall biosynthesis
MNKCKISVALISYNEEHRISNTLESLSGLASEIILIDSGSTDRTQEIAESFGATVYVEEWNGFASAKNSALEKCTSDWVLFLDCDEVLTPELRVEIASQVCLKNDYSGYRINRRSVYCGKIMQYSWQPDRKLRLVKKNAKPKWVGHIVHEELIVEGKIGTLKGEILHYSYTSIADHFAKTIKYASLSSQDYELKGKKVSFVNLILNPIFAFVNMYFVKGAFLDGKLGLVAAFSSMCGTFLKYAMLYERKLITNNDK